MKQKLKIPHPLPQKTSPQASALSPPTTAPHAISQKNLPLLSNEPALTNDYHGTRVFCTTLGHDNKTVSDERYLNFITRGVLWSCDKLNPTYQKPYTGPNGKFEIIPAQSKPPQEKK